MSLTEQFQQIDLLHRQITEQGKLSDELLKKINYKFRLDWNYYSNSMEGNSLTRQETRSVMVGNITVDGKPIKDVLEVKGHDDVISQILKMGKGELNLSEKRIREIHMAIMHEDDPEKAKQIGQWKLTANHLINYKGEKFDFVAPADVPERMHKLINWLNTEKEKIERKAKDALHPALLAFQFHLDYVSIHPFFDGNGRTARIFTNLILIAYGYPPVYIRTDEKTRYYQYLADIQGYGGSAELYYEFMAGLLVRSLKIVQDAIAGREIEEEGDWEKKLMLLKQQMQPERKNKFKKTEEKVLFALRNSIVPLLQKLNETFSNFEPLFVGKQLRFGFNGEVSNFVSMDDVLSSIETPYRPAINIYSLTFEYGLENFSAGNAYHFSVSTWVMADFSDVEYIIRNEDAGIIPTTYGQVLDTAVISSFVNLLASRLLTTIEQQINRK